MSIIERKYKLRNWKYNFTYIQCRGIGVNFLLGTRVTWSETPLGF